MLRIHTVKKQCLGSAIAGCTYIPVCRVQTESRLSCCLSPWPPITTAQEGRVNSMVWPHRALGRGAVHVIHKEILGKLRQLLSKFQNITKNTSNKTALANSYLHGGLVKCTPTWCTNIFIKMYSLCMCFIGLYIMGNIVYIYKQTHLNKEQFTQYICTSDYQMKLIFLLNND